MDELENVSQKLVELTKEFKLLQAKLKVKPKVQLMPMTIKAAFPGDVWCYPPNINMKCGNTYTVKSVNKKKNHVYFTDGGWNPLDELLSGEWVLITRKLTPKTALAGIRRQDGTRKIAN